MTSDLALSPMTGLGLRPVINAAGNMTYLGSSTLSPVVTESMAAMAASPVDMQELKAALGARIGEMTGSGGGFICSSAAAGIMIAVAACLCGVDPGLVEALPSAPARRRVLIQRGHAVNFGAPILQMIRLTGAEAVEIGAANATQPFQLQHALGPETAAFVHVVSHHTAQSGMLPLETVVALCHERDVPVIVDAAAEMDLRGYVAAGADLVIYSGHKAISGPTSGLICGRVDLIAACMLQEKGLARAMKAGKETMGGLYQALRDYDPAEAMAAERQAALVAELERALTGVPGCETLLLHDATRPIARVALRVRPEAPFTAHELVRRLEEGSPSIRVRGHRADEGIIQFDPRQLGPGEPDLIGARVYAEVARLSNGSRSS
jgi:uncharacterized pyridoxal phosphate-dependent enzyme